MHLFFRYDIPDSGSVSGYGPVAGRISGYNKLDHLSRREGRRETDESRPELGSENLHAP